MTYKFIFGNANLGQDSIGTVFQGPGFESRSRCTFFTSIKVASSWRTLLQVAPEGVLTLAGIAKY